MPDDLSPDVRYCKVCGGELYPQDSFCGTCGSDQAIAGTSPPAKEDVFSSMAPALAYYFITLVLLGVYKFTELFPEGLDGIYAISIIDIAVVIVFWALSYRHVEPLFSLRGLKLSVFLLVIIGAFAGSA